MKRGFTLIELLIVTVVIAILGSIVFRLAGLGGDSKARAITIRRMQCLENCLSGYYAAYGSYPPVPLQGRSRSIYSSVDVLDVQQRGDESGGSGLNARQAHYACRAQPVAAVFPFGKSEGISEAIDELSKACQYYLPKTQKYQVLFSNVLEDSPGGINSRLSKTSNWGSDADSGSSDDNVQVFQFGLMSFLLPRYQFMMEGNEDFYAHGQWGDSNEIPCRLDNGQPYASWSDIVDYMGGRNNGNSTRWEKNMIVNLTSQSVCARWMPNLQGIVTGGRTFYGVDTSCSENDDYYMQVPGFTSDGIEYDELHVHSMNGYSKGSGGGSRYLLNCMTVRDGWHLDFYYYSDVPYQSYRLWSAGPNRKSFPPWYSLDSFSASDVTKIRSWTDDDIVHMSH